MDKQFPAVGGLLEAIESWVETVKANKADHARVETEKLKIFGRLLVENPNFRHIYRRNLNDCATQEPEEALGCVYAFFNSVAESSRAGRFRNGRS